MLPASCELREHFTAHDTTDRSLVCAICMDSWIRPVQLLPCSHVFCADCVAPLSVCPMCRAVIQARTTPEPLLLSLAETALVSCRYCPWVGSREESRDHSCEEGIAAIIEEQRQLSAVCCCPKGHSLQPVAHKPQGYNGWQCDRCWSKIIPPEGNEVPAAAHCPQCKFDLCLPCRLLGPPKCPHGHSLRTAQSSIWSLRKSRYCPSCETKLDSCPRYFECTDCPYAACGPCALTIGCASSEQSHASLGSRRTRCPRGHSLELRTRKPKQYKRWCCDRCKGAISEDPGCLAAGHCRHCMYDLCGRCLPLGPLQCPHDGEEMHTVKALSVSDVTGPWCCSSCALDLLQQERCPSRCSRCTFVLCHSCVQRQTRHPPH